MKNQVLVLVSHFHDILLLPSLFHFLLLSLLRYLLQEWRMILMKNVLKLLMLFERDKYLDK